MTAPDDARPRVIVHMASSVDGRVQTRRWSGAGVGHLYEDVHADLAGDAWMCGRITMQGYTRGTPSDDRDPSPVARTDHFARRDAPAYAVALDARGALHWGDRNTIEDDHVVVVLLEGVSDQHLNALKASGVSYLFGGRDTIDFGRVFGTLRRELGIKRLLVEGGGGINGSIFAAGFVDELSLLVAPAVDGGRAVPSVFDHGEPGDPPPRTDAKLTLRSCRTLSDGVVHLHYTIAYAAM